MVSSTHILPDLLRPGLRVVFCGTAAGNASAKQGVYYAGSNNSFWKTLHSVGFTPRLLRPSEYDMLLEFGIGLTDIVKCRHGNDGALSSSDFDVLGFREKIHRFAPGAIAFNGKKAAEFFLSTHQSKLSFGLQPGGEPRVWILPSTSGLARRWWVVQHWHDCASSILK